MTMSMITVFSAAAESADDMITMAKLTVSTTEYVTANDAATTNLSGC
jgi:hypothetical protein